MTPLLGGALAALFVGIGLLGVPMLLDRGPLERLAGRAGGAPEGRGSLVACCATANNADRGCSRPSEVRAVISRNQRARPTARPRMESGGK